MKRDPCVSIYAYSTGKNSKQQDYHTFGMYHEDALEMANAIINQIGDGTDGVTLSFNLKEVEAKSGKKFFSPYCYIKTREVQTNSKSYQKNHEYKKQYSTVNVESKEEIEKKIAELKSKVIS